MRELARWGMRRIRLWRPDRNPLRRRWDRWETLAVAMLLGLGLLAVIPAVGMANAAYELGVARESQGRWVSVRLTADAPSVLRVSPDSEVLPETPVRWTRADGRTVKVFAPVPPGAKAGDSVRLWADASGHLVSGPQDHTTTVAQAVTVGVGAMFVVAGAIGAAFGAIRWGLDRRRYAAWEAAWIEADDHWRRRKN